MNPLSNVCVRMTGRERGDLILACLIVGVLVISSSGAQAQTGSLSGHVLRDADGSPLAVWVRLYQGDDPNIADEDARNWTNQAHTDANGLYRFTNLQERRYRVCVVAQEIESTHYFEANLYNVQVLAGSETANMNLRLRQAGLIYGYVKTQTGDPIPYAEVIAHASWTKDGDSRHSASTDETGRYEFPVAPSPGKFYPVWVSSASLDGTNYASAWDGNLYQATLAGTQVPDYVLQPGGTVTGRVVNESGVGIGGVLLYVEDSPEPVDIGPHAFTTSDGHFALFGVIPGINSFTVDSGWQEIERDGVKYMVGRTSTGPVSVSAGGTVDVGTFTIYAAGTVTGVVTDEGGSPIVDAEIWVEGEDINGDEMDSDEVSTDAFGQYTVDYIAPGNYGLHCYKDGFAEAIDRNVRVARGQHVERDLVLKSAAEAGTLRGKVTNYAAIRAKDSQGVPLPWYEDSEYNDWGYADVGLLALPMDGPWTAQDFFLHPSRLFLGERDSDDIEDGYGDYFVTDANEVPGRYGDWLIPAGDVALCLHYGDVEKVGDVWSVTLSDWKRLSLSAGDVRTDVDFTYTAPVSPGVVKGNLNVPDGYNNFRESWAEIYAFRLDANGNIVTLIPMGDAVGGPGWTQTYELCNLQAGNYRLCAYARNLASVVIDSVTVVAGQTTTQDITFTAGGTLAGQVTDGASPISGATVAVTETGAEAITDASGNYGIAGLNTGSYTVTVSASGYADAQGMVSITEGSTTTRNFALSNTAGSISGTVKDSQGVNINGVTILAYNETDRSQKSDVTVAGAFTIEPLTPGNYILAVNTDQYGVVVYPADPGRITLGANEDVSGIEIVVGSPVPPVFSVHSSVNDGSPAVLSLEFSSDQDLLASPSVSVVSGGGVLGALTSNAVLNRFEIEYTADANDDLVLIRIEETTPLVSGNPGGETFSFEVGSNLVMTSTTNVTNALGGTVSIMGTQDNTHVYVPPLAIAGPNDASEAIPLTIERYGDPGDAVVGDSNQTVTAVYDFKFGADGVSVDEDHTFTVTMSFQLPSGMTLEEFENTLTIKYFDAGDQKWKTDGISNVKINSNQTVTFEVSHLTRFAGFVGEDAGPLLHDWNGDGIRSIVGDVPPFVQCVYFSTCPDGVDTIAVGDCNGDDILSIVGDVPCFVQCVYFGNCDE